jgi:hypothetical protein
MSAGALALGLIHAAPALLSLPSVDLPLCFRSSHFSVGAHPSGVVVPNASPVVQLGLPGLCHLSAAASGRAPPFRLSSFPYPRVPALYDSIAAGPRQAAVATPVAGGCRFVPVGALVLGPYALPLSCGPCLRWIFGCFSALFVSRVCSTKPPNVAVPDASPAVRLRLPCLCRLIFLSRNVLSLSALFTFIFNGANAQYLHRYWSSPSGRCHIRVCFRRLPSYLCGGLVLNLRRAASALLTLPSVDLRLLSALLVSPCPGFWSRHFDPYSRHSGPVRSSTCLPP